MVRVALDHRLLSCSRQVARSPRKELASLSWTVLPWLCGCVSSGRLAVALTGGLWGLGLHWGCGFSVGLGGLFCVAPGGVSM